MKTFVLFIIYFIILFFYVEAHNQVLNNNFDSLSSNKNYNKEMQLLANGTREELLYHSEGDIFHEHCYIPKGRSSCAPQFIIAGFMKCGTTSLHSYLLNHPQILPIENFNTIGLQLSVGKEVVFFSSDKLYENSLLNLPLREIENTYYNIFPNITPIDNPNSINQLFVGDSSPSYAESINCVRRAYHALPEAKVIVLIRDPIDRIYSEYCFRSNIKNIEIEQDIFINILRAIIKRAEYCNLSQTLNTLTINNIEQFKSCVLEFKCSSIEYLKSYCKNSFINIELPRIFLRSFYIFGLLEWKRFYQDNLMIVLSEDFFTNTSKVTNSIANFIGLLDIFNWETITNSIYNFDTVINTNTTKIIIDKAKKQNPILSKDIKDELSKIFKPANKLIEDLFGISNLWK